MLVLATVDGMAEFGGGVVEGMEGWMDGMGQGDVVIGGTSIRFPAVFWALGSLQVRFAMFFLRG